MIGVNRSAILVLEVHDQDYHSLSFQRLTLNMAQKLNAQLTGNARKTYTTAHDIIIGPLVYQPKIEQQKLQSTNAQSLLNFAKTQRTVL